MKKFSSKRSVQILANLMKHFAIEDIILSPGSRNAPLSIHFAEIAEFNNYSIVDERSAAYVGLGMALKTKKPAAICCTSGSSVANYYPAITEAFYANIPLLVLTADRPATFTDLFDGQTIRQNYLFEQHSYGNFQLLEDNEKDADLQNFAIIKEAIETCIHRQGPVHINIPLSEPLYETVAELPIFESVSLRKDEIEYVIPNQLITQWKAAKKILILVGTQAPSKVLNNLLEQLVKNHTAVVLSEINSNIKHSKFFSHIDRYIFNFTKDDVETYRPDLLITLGQNVVSKKVKQFLRQTNPHNHWHVDPYWHPDTYHCLTEKINTTPQIFLTELLKFINPQPSHYFNMWEELRLKNDQKHLEYIEKINYSDLLIYKKMADIVPKEYALHFSNSSAIRYAQLFDFSSQNVYCNRGTSGIDGCTSTAMGFAMKSEQPTLLITGDLAFFYDVNGLWNQYIPPYTRIILINNAEGNIFKIIPGSEHIKQDVLDEFIVTKHNYNAESICKHFGFEYLKVEEEFAIDRGVEQFFKPGMKPKLIEFQTQNTDSEGVLKHYFEYLK